MGRPCAVSIGGMRRIAWLPLLLVLTAPAVASADAGRVVGATVAVAGTVAPTTAAPTTATSTTAAPAPPAVADPPVAHAAASASVAIRDFSFGPKTVTVHVGDTITWANAGPTAHTATADDGAFDTGTLKAGQSGSHTFASAGTFAYHCTLHPFMRGTVQVVASAAPAPAGSTGAAAPAAGAPASTPASTGPTLPSTGLDAPLLAALGAACVLGGLLLRARTRTR